MLRSQLVKRKEGGATRRRKLVGLAAAGLVVSLIAPASADAATAYTFSQQFTISTSEDQEGLAQSLGVHYVGFDLGSGNGRIVAYDDSGKLVKRSGVLRTGHTNEISYRNADKNLYVTNSSLAPTGIAVVDMRLATPAVIRRIPIAMAYGSVAAVDNGKDQLVVVTGNTGGPYTMVFASMTGKVLRRVPIPDEGITQGLEVVGGQILLLTSLKAPVRNRITVFSATGSILKTIPVPVARESEGLSVRPSTNQLYIGFDQPARVLRMSPAFTPVR